MDASMVQRFECPICLASYEYCLPKILPCIHTVCEQCLRGLIQVGKGRKFKCPICREDIKAPREGTQGFKTNIYLVPDHSPAGKKQNTTVCAFCAEKGQTYTHLQCGHKLCNACSQTKASTSNPRATDSCPVCVSEAPSLPPRPPPLQSANWNPPPTPPMMWPGQAGQWPGPSPQWPNHPGQAPSPYLPPDYPDPQRQWTPIRQPMNEPPPLQARPVMSPVSPSAPPLEENAYDGYDTFKNITDPLQGEAWYCGEISRDQSHEILRNDGRDGYFLVRKTIKGDPSHVYTLDILYGGSEYHLKIKRRPDGRFYLKNNLIEAKHFDDVRALIHHHTREKFVIQDGKSGREFKVALQLPGV